MYNLSYHVITVKTSVTIFWLRGIYIWSYFSHFAVKIFLLLFEYQGLGFDGFEGILNLTLMRYF